ERGGDTAENRAERARGRAPPPPAVAAAVLPRHPESLGPVTTFALHGALQLLPLSALPLAAPVSGPLFLGEVKTAALAAAGARAATGGGPERPPVFVVDPTGDLGG